MIPKQAPFVFLLLLGIGLVAGFVTDILFAERTDAKAACHNDFDLHEENLCHCFSRENFLEQWAHCSAIRNQLVILLIACLVGLIPESGPHLLFLTLFAENTLPFSIFLASSIVQDGHGMLPLLAESQRDFLKVKAINFVVGLLTGVTGYIFGW